MAFRRNDSKNWYFQARTETAFKPLSTRTPNVGLARKIEGMWEDLAVNHRAFDLLNPVLQNPRSIGNLFDKYLKARHAVGVMRSMTADLDVGAFVGEWAEYHQSQNAKMDSTRHALAHVRYLIPAGSLALASTFTVDRLTRRLTSYEGARNTRRKVHSSWSMFFDYCTRIKGAFPANPMAQVDRPRQETHPIKFYESEDVERIVMAQPTAARRAIMAIQYGGALDVSTTLNLSRSDVYVAEMEIRAAGTKAHSRDRICRVATWAWKFIAPHLKSVERGGKLFDAGWNRWSVSDWHRETVKRLGLPQYPLRNARHHWAVRSLRAGVPIGVVQHQLGHGTAKLTLDTYGAFIPTGQDREEWERRVTEHERKRRETA